MSEVTIFIGLDSVRCATCGTVFGMSSHHKQSRIDDSAAFYCPNGHAQSFKGNEAERLRERVARLQATISEIEAESERRLVRLQRVQKKLHRLTTKGKR